MADFTNCFCVEDCFNSPLSVQEMEIVKRLASKLENTHPSVFNRYLLENAIDRKLNADIQAQEQEEAKGITTGQKRKNVEPHPEQHFTRTRGPAPTPDNGFCPISRKYSHTPNHVCVHCEANKD